MSLRIFCFAMIALGLVAPAANAASIASQFVLLMPSPDNTVIQPTVPGGTEYNMLPGTAFRVRLQARVLNPNITDNQRQDQNGDPIFVNVPLGILNLNGQLSTSGVNVVNPIANNAFVPPRWNGFLSGTGNPPFANLIDVGSDGDLDPTGVGAARTDLSINEFSTIGNFQLGASSFATIFTGQYQAVGAGTTSLSYNAETAQVYGDSASNPDTNAVFADNVLSTFTNAAITINVVPEPSTFALAGMGLVGLVVAYRRRKTA